ncbi:MAG TPA: hypothetical protein VJ208_01415 [Candidatus Nanoarchaeia archaeon]|nr:hypothetical protein [Candidatus Nanoarchaeia archaeon]
MKLEKKLIFHSGLWAGKDVGNNSQFWKEALILSKNEHEGTATVLFLFNYEVSYGHFIDAMKEVNKK